MIHRHLTKKQESISTLGHQSKKEDRITSMAIFFLSPTKKHWAVIMIMASEAGRELMVVGGGAGRNEGKG